MRKLYPSANIICWYLICRRHVIYVHWVQASYSDPNKCTNDWEHEQVEPNKRMNISIKCLFMLPHSSISDVNILHLLQLVQPRQLFVRVNHVLPICHVFRYLRQELPSIMLNNYVLKTETVRPKQINKFYLQLAQRHRVFFVRLDVYWVDPVHQRLRIPFI